MVNSLRNPLIGLLCLSTVGGDKHGYGKDHGKGHPGRR